MPLWPELEHLHWLCLDSPYNDCTHNTRSHEISNLKNTIACSLPICSWTNPSLIQILIWISDKYRLIGPSFMKSGSGNKDLNLIPGYFRMSDVNDVKKL